MSAVLVRRSGSGSSLEASVRQSSADEQVGREMGVVQITTCPEKKMQTTSPVTLLSPKLGATLANKQRWSEETWECTAAETTSLNQDASVRSKLKAILGSSSRAGGKKKPLTLLTNKKQGVVGYYCVERLGTGTLG